MVFANPSAVDLACPPKSSVGQVGIVRELTTRKGDRFVSVQFGLLGGDIELVVWSNVLAVTEDLWKQGTFVSLTGSVRERDGRVSISVEEAREYRLPGQEDSTTLTNQDQGQPGAAISPAATTTPAPSQTVNNGSTENGVPASRAMAENGAQFSAPATGSSGAIRYSNGNGNGARPEQPGASSAQAQHLSVRVTETGSAAEDKYRFEDIIRLLLNYKGDQPFMLEIATRDRIVTLEMPFAIKPCDELAAHLCELIGSENVLMPGVVSAASA